MKKIVMVAVLGLFVSAASGLAQTVYDGAKLTGKDLNGTARFVGMGGAMGDRKSTRLNSSHNA